jgi:hypothetical protein
MYKNKLTAAISLTVILLMFVPWILPIAQAQTDTPFTASDKFNIPETNSTISFGANGTYSSAVYQNGTWTFINLRINASAVLNTFTISAQNTNIIIRNYRLTNGTYLSARLACSVSGQGTFTVNFGLNLQVTKASARTDWIVGAANGLFLGLGDHWNVQPDATVSIDDVTGNVSISYSAIHNYIANNFGNQTVLGAHSALIISAVVLAAALSITFAVRTVNDKKQDKIKLEEEAKLARDRTILRKKEVTS